MDENSSSRDIAAKGRGSNVRPANRFSTIDIEEELEYLENDREAADDLRNVKTRYYADSTQSILSTNESPDIHFNYSLNPYRGCSHGCSYCYARPSHEYLGFDGGLDFESKIMVKLTADTLLRDWLARPQWKCEPIVFSGVTDCYQPAERRFGLTRKCLEVAQEAHQPVEIVTKNSLVTRDIDILADMASRKLIRVAISITSLDQSLTKRMEPRTSTPAARLAAIRQLSEAGVPTTVMVAPVIPGLNASEIPQILKQAKESGATNASYVLLRLPHSVEPVFLEWLDRFYPLRKQKIVALQKETRGGKLNDSDFSQRMVGQGPIAEQIKQTFDVFKNRLELTASSELDCSQFRPPVSSNGQLYLF